MEFSIEEFNAPSKSFKHNYKKICILGKGAFGKVYKVKEIATDKIFAVKQISINNSELNYELVLKEINVLSNISHPNIVKYYKYYEESNKIYIIMEYLEGGTLKEFINNEKNKINEDICRIIIKQILNALNHLHYIDDICHRDIKPENIMFGLKDNINTIKLIDFGLSSNSFEHKNYLENCGTLIYMAPEQISNKIYSKSVDIWSIGIILYMLLNNGRNPFYNKGESREKIIYKIRNKKVEFDDKNYPISEMGKDFIKKLLKKNSSSRYTVRPALNHPWITMEKFEKIPMTVLDKLLIDEYINKLNDLFLIALFMNNYKKNNLKINLKKISNIYVFEEILKKNYNTSCTNFYRKKKYILNNEINKNNYNNFDLDEYFQRVKKSNILLEKKFKENREIMFMTKNKNNDNIYNENCEEKNNIINNKIKNIDDENDKYDGNINKRKRNNYFSNILKKNTIYQLKNSSTTNINGKLKKNINKKKEMKNSIKESEITSDYRVNYSKNINENNIIRNKRANIIESANNQRNYINNKKENKINNILTSLQEFIIKEKSVKKFNQINGLFITDNHKDKDKEINIYPKKNNFKSKENTKIFSKDSKPKSREKKLTKKNSCMNVNHYKFQNLIKNYSNNNLILRNKFKNKSVDNIYSLNFKKSTLKKNKIDKNNFYVQQDNNYHNKRNFCLSSTKNNNETINNIYNVNNIREINPSKLLFDIKHKILPKISNRK